MPPGISLIIVPISPVGFSVTMGSWAVFPIIFSLRRTLCARSVCEFIYPGASRQCPVSAFSPGASSPRVPGMSKRACPLRLCPLRLPPASPGGMPGPAAPFPCHRRPGATRCLPAVPVQPGVLPDPGARAGGGVGHDVPRQGPPGVRVAPLGGGAWLEHLEEVVKDIGEPPLPRGLVDRVAGGAVDAR